MHEVWEKQLQGMRFQGSIKSKDTSILLQHKQGSNVAEDKVW